MQKIEETKKILVYHEHSCIQRSSVLKTALSGSVSLQRELGQHESPCKRRDIQAQVFVKNLNLVTRRIDRQLGSLARFEISTNYNLLVCALHCHISGRDLHAIQAGTLFSPTKLENRMQALTNVSPSFSSEISSILPTTNGLLVITSLGGSAPAEIQVHKQADLQSKVVDGFSISSVYFSMTANPHTTLWCASANQNPSSSPDKIVLGADGELIELIYRPDAISDLKPVTKTGSDTLALSWLSANVVSAGLRGGSILLWDHRSRGSALRLQHAGTVCSLQRAETENLLLVAGMQDSLAMYDLRMPRIDFNDKISGSKNPKLNKSIKRTRPFLQFIDYENTYHYPIGMDFCKDLGIVAVSQKDDHVKFFSRHNGNCIGSTCRQDMALDKHELVSSVSGFENPKMNSCLRFIRGGRDDVYLFSNRRGVLQNYSW